MTCKYVGIDSCTEDKIFSLAENEFYEEEYKNLPIDK